MTDAISRVLDAYGRCEPLTAGEQDKLCAKGVIAASLDYDKGSGLFRIAAAKVVFEGPWFNFEKHGKRRPIIVCRDESGHVADIVAWEPGEDTAHRWLGHVSMIGEEACTRPRLSGDKLWVRESVLDWLRHARTGVVILDHDRARSVLTAATQVAVKSSEHKRRLDTLWKPPEVRVFDVGVAESATEAA